MNNQGGHKIFALKRGVLGTGGIEIYHWRNEKQEGTGHGFSDEIGLSMCSKWATYGYSSLVAISILLSSINGS